jgi:hypothetical protein
MGILQLAVFEASPNTALFIIYYHIYAYLFYYFAFYSKTKIKEELSKTDLFILAANFSVFSYNLFDAMEGSLVTLGGFYLLNAAIFGAILFLNWKKVNKQIKLVFFIGSFVAFAIPSIFD